MSSNPSTYRYLTDAEVSQAALQLEKDLAPLSQDMRAKVLQLLMGAAIQAQPTCSVKITERTNACPPGKLADAELHFHGGPLDGNKLIGFAVWERRSGTGRNVTFPARTYSVNGERRSFSLLRPAGGDSFAQDRIREMVLQAYQVYEDSADSTKLENTSQFDATGARVTTPTPVPGSHTRDDRF